MWVKLGFFSSWKREGQGNEQPCSDFLEGGLILRSSQRLKLSLVWFLGWFFLASKACREILLLSPEGLSYKVENLCCLWVTAANPQSGLGQQSQSTQLGIFEAAGGKSRGWQQAGIWHNWEVQGSVCCLLSCWAWWRHSVKEILGTSSCPPGFFKDNFRSLNLLTQNWKNAGCKWKLLAVI